MATLIALVPFAAVIADYSKLLTLPTLRAVEALRSAGKLQGREALFLSSIGLDEIRLIYNLLANVQGTSKIVKWT